MCFLLECGCGEGWWGIAFFFGFFQGLDDASVVGEDCDEVVDFLACGEVFTVACRQVGCLVLG